MLQGRNLAIKTWPESKTQYSLVSTAFLDKENMLSYMQ